MSAIQPGSYVYFHKENRAIDTFTETYITLCKTGNTAEWGRMLANTVVLQTIERTGGNIAKGSCLRSEGKKDVIHHLATCLFASQQHPMHQSTTNEGSFDRTITFNIESTPHSVTQLICTLQFRFPMRKRGKTVLSYRANGASPLITHIAVSRQSIRV